MIPAVARPLVALVIAALAAGCAAFQSKNQPSPSVGAGVPPAIPQPITRTSPGAQVAWLTLTSGSGAIDMIAVDGAGHQVARFSPAWTAASGDRFGIWRTPDGASILQAKGGSILSFDAVDGKLRHSYTVAAGEIMADAFSPDGRYLALLLFESGQVRLDIIDRQGGTSPGILPVPHDPAARKPGEVSVSGQSAPWSVLTFASNSLLYVITDYGGPARLLAFSLEGGPLHQVGASPQPLPLTCGGALAVKVVADGATLAGFCHFDGGVWFVDLKQPANSSMVHSGQPNPMWDSPIFRPDGRVLYLVETGLIRVVDLSQRSLVGVTPMPKAVAARNVLSELASLLITPAEAGFIASTMPISPDGLRLYVADGDAVLALDASTLKLLARLPAGETLGEVWVSGNGSWLYATAENGRRVLVMGSDGKGLHAVDVPGYARFIASEHG